jgi:hypothetical protein
MRMSAPEDEIDTLRLALSSGSAELTPLIKRPAAWPADNDGELFLFRAIERIAAALAPADTDDGAQAFFNQLRFALQRGDLVARAVFDDGWSEAIFADRWRGDTSELFRQATYRRPGHHSVFAENVVAWVFLTEASV